MPSAPNVSVPCPKCGNTISTKQIHYDYDPGCWRTPDGDGWPSSEEFIVEEWGPCVECGFSPDTDASPEELDRLTDVARDEFGSAQVDLDNEAYPDDFDEDNDIVDDDYWGGR
jgi:hypothetical protein